MPSTDSWQERPYAIVDHIFANHVGDGWVEAVLNEFQTKVGGTDTISAIPSLNDCAIQDLLPNSLVRFRCMIQDSYENEVFLQSCLLKNRKTEQKIRKTSFFRDVIDCPDDFEIEHTPASYGMRQVLYCVTIPAECDWTKKGWKDAGATKLNCSSFTTSRSLKRKRESDDEMEVASSDDMSDKQDSEESKRAKRSHEGSHGTSEAVFNKNHPIPSESGPVCLVKIYDESVDVKVNQIYEFYGILSVDPVLSSLYDTDDNEMDAADAEEAKARHPPPSLVPRLHVVHMKQLCHINPYVDREISQNIGIPSEIQSSRSCLMEILEKATFGDSLTAEYLLLHLLARVYSRHSEIAFGKFSLNIYGISPESDYPVVLCNFLKELVTKMHYLPLSVENFNSIQFVPTKNYNTNRLDSGLLQLSDGTHLFIDETTLQPGDITANGTNNFEIELKPKTPITKDVKSYFSSFCSTILSETLDKCRCYITSTKFLKYELSDEISKTIQDDFVNARRQNPQVSGEDLHTWLVMARLMSISFGCQNLKKEKWDRVKMLESQRIARVAGTTQTNGH